MTESDGKPLTDRRTDMLFLFHVNYSLLSFDFSLTRIFMKLFRTGSSVVVTECQKPFSFLSLRYQVDIRNVNFMVRFMATENFICNVLALQAIRILADIYTRYGDSVDSI